MINSLNNCTITVNRRSTSSKNSIGEPIYSESAVYTNIPATFQLKKGATKFLEDGERITFDSILFVDSSNVLHVMDQVTNTIDNITRKVVSVDPKFGSMNLLHHYEILMIEP